MHLLPVQHVEATNSVLHISVKVPLCWSIKRTSRQITLWSVMMMLYLSVIDIFHFTDTLLLFKCYINWNLSTCWRWVSNYFFDLVFIFIHRNHIQNDKQANCNNTWISGDCMRFCHIDPIVNWAISDSGSGLSPLRHHAITWNCCTAKNKPR